MTESVTITVVRYAPFTAKKEEYEGGYKVKHDNGVYLGDILAMEDGFYTFWPYDSLNGYYDESCLRSLTFILEKLNSEWHKTVMNDPNI